MIETRPLALDNALPDRDRLLDDAFAIPRLKTAIGSHNSVDDLIRVRTKYRFGHSLRTLYRGSNRQDGKTAWISMRALAPGMAEREYERALERGRHDPGLTPWRLDADLNAIFWRFPNDRCISSLGTLGPACADSLKRNLSIVSYELAAYAPEKCATARCFDPDERVVGYAKIYATRQALESAQILANLSEQLNNRAHSAAKLHLPKIIGSEPNTNTLFVAPVPGRLIANLRGSNATYGMAMFGTALAELHGLHPPDSIRPFERLSGRALVDAAHVIGSALPDLATRAIDLCGRLLDFRERSETAVCLHGDVHPKNALTDGDVVTLIDLDQCSIGDPALDLGSFLAGFHCARISHWPYPVSTEGARAFLRGYAKRRHLPNRQSLRWHTAAALFGERCVRAVHRLRPHSLANMEALLRACESGLDGSSLDV